MVFVRRGTGHPSPWQVEAYNLVCGQIIHHVHHAWLEVKKAISHGLQWQSMACIFQKQQLLISIWSS